MLIIALSNGVRAVASTLGRVAHALNHALEMLLSPVAYRSGICCTCSSEDRTALYEDYA
jgi:hypothetical protein